MNRNTLFGLVMLTCTAAADQVCDTTPFPASAPVERFADNGDGTVTDQSTHLMWMRCSVGQTWSEGDCRGTPTPRAWASASAYAAELNGSGALFYSDWRLPKLPELASIVERDCTDPRINLTIFPSTPAQAYWTSTPRPGPADEGLVYALDFGVEGVIPQPRDREHLVRLVRSGP